MRHFNVINNQAGLPFFVQTRRIAGFDVTAINIPAHRIAELHLIEADQVIRSKAEDLDLAEAISDLSTKETVYQAALKSYATMGKMSLFDYIGT